MGLPESESKQHELVVTGTNSYVDIQYGSKTARFWGDLCADGFAAIESTMECIVTDNKSFWAFIKRDDVTDSIYSRGDQAMGLPFISERIL